ncbi:maleylpyruvate isomerase family mycothiol-dependent enzyme [Dactylosporangium sp. CA-092794]|uniref:maleylpyruvate isomerase family mycothiol-dependent enzyme n=1 Tax=Dactylosporangium sp. CA-092794 TaxID=3239929 RepID=UPI003D92CEEB
MTTSTTTTIPRRGSAPRTPAIGRDEAMALAAAEYERGAELLQGLEPGQWSAPTVNTGWDVRATAGHVLGMMEMMSSVPQMVGQTLAAQRAARRRKAPTSLDELTALQVRRNAGLGTGELVAKWRAVASKAVRGRRRLPALLRRRAMPELQLIGGQLEPWTFGYLADVILTRDPFMHRLDICAATGLPPHVTAEHDGRIVDDIVHEWADRHGRPYRLELAGPAGGTWGTGEGEPIRLDALDFCRVLSGRGTATGLLTTAVAF